MIFSILTDIPVSPLISQSPKESLSGLLASITELSTKSTRKLQGFIDLSQGSNGHCTDSDCHSCGRIISGGSRCANFFSDPLQLYADLRYV